MIDLESKGPKFTWREPWTNHATRLFKRLDRALCNKEWRIQFNEAIVRVGPCIQSDHHPLFIHLTAWKGNRDARPFMFEAAWLTHCDFKDMLQRKWTGIEFIKNELAELESHLKDWNINSFGHIAKKKKELLQRIKGIQKAIQRRP